MRCFITDTPSKKFTIVLFYIIAFIIDPITSFPINGEITSITADYQDQATAVNRIYKPTVSNIIVSSYSPPKSALNISTTRSNNNSNISVVKGNSLVGISPLESEDKPTDDDGDQAGEQNSKKSGKTNDSHDEVIGIFLAVFIGTPLLFSLIVTICIAIFSPDTLLGKKKRRRVPDAQIIFDDNPQPGGQNYRGIIGSGRLVRDVNTGTAVLNNQDLQAEEIGDGEMVETDSNSASIGSGAFEDDTGEEVDSDETQEENDSENKNIVLPPLVTYKSIKHKKVLQDFSHKLSAAALYNKAAPIMVNDESDSGSTSGSESITGSFKTNYMSQCPICIDDFEDSHMVVVLPCKHFFHGYCLEQAVGSSSKCPVCRFDLSDHLANDS